MTLLLPRVKAALVVLFDFINQLGYFTSKINVKLTLTISKFIHNPKKQIATQSTQKATFIELTS